MDRIQEKLLKTIEELVTFHSRRLPYDRTITAKVEENLGSGLFRLSYQEQDMECKVRAGLSLSVGDIVYVCVPQNKMENKYIIDKRP